MQQRVVVVGVGADGWDGLPPASREAVRSADVLLGGRRHLAMVPDTTALREPWPSPLLDNLPGLLERYDGRRVVVLASGDPMLHGIGTNLLALLGPGRVEVRPAVSSVSLACARMGWSAESVEVVSVVGRDLDAVRCRLSPRNRLVVLSGDGTTPEALAGVLVGAGFGDSEMTVLSDLGSGAEQRRTARARDWADAPAPALNVVCVDCRAAPSAPAGPGGWHRGPGLPDDAFEHDGQITKRDLRVSALSRLAPAPGHLLWDVGAGAGSVAVEWLRVDPRCRAVAVEADPVRAGRIVRNAGHLGVPSLRVEVGTAPEALAGLPAPDAVFVGGGASRPGLVDRCWEALAPGGRLVAHAVTLEAERVLLDSHRALGGELTRLAVEHAAPLGGLTGWRPARPVVQWAATKTGSATGTVRGRDGERDQDGEGDGT